MFRSLSSRLAFIAFRCYLRAVHAYARMPFVANYNMNLITESKRQSRELHKETTVSHGFDSAWLLN